MEHTEHEVRCIDLISELFLASMNINPESFESMSTEARLVMLSQLHLLEARVFSLKESIYEANDKAIINPDEALTEKIRQAKFPFKLLRIAEDILKSGKLESIDFKNLTRAEQDRLSQMVGISVNASKLEKQKNE